MFDLKVPAQLKAAVAETEFKLFVNKGKDDGPAELLVMDDIGEDWFGEGITGKMVSKFLVENAGREVNVKINSFGGDAYAGLSIFNDLKRHDAKVTTENMGIAFSAASIIFSAGEDRVVHEATDFGIHRASSGIYGNAANMRAMSNWLDSLDSHLIEVYQSTTGMSEDDLTALIDGEDGVLGTVFTAKEALEKGFATKLIPATERNKQAASADAQATVVRRLRAEHAMKLAQLGRNRA